MKEILEKILNGENPRNIFLEEKPYTGKVRFPVDVEDVDISKLSEEQLRQIRQNSKKVFKWMQEFVKGSGLDSCDIILRKPDKSQIYVEITPRAVAFTPNLYHYTVSDFADDSLLSLVVLNWPKIKEKVKSACEWLVRNKKETEIPDDVSSRLANFAL